MARLVTAARVARNERDAWRRTAEERGKEAERLYDVNAGLERRLIDGELAWQVRAERVEEAARALLHSLRRHEFRTSMQGRFNAIAMWAGNYRIEPSLWSAWDDEERAALMAVVRLEDLVGEPWHKLRDQALPQAAIEALGKGDGANADR